MLKNIIFDLGGVILNIDFQKTIDAFSLLGIKNIDKMYSSYSQYGFFDNFDKGLITSNQFRDEIRKYIPNNATDKQIDDAWNKMLLDFPNERIEFLNNIKAKYRTFLLSNTNAIHFPVYNKQLKDKFGINCLSDLFEKAYYSFLLGMRKPDKEIFEFIIKKNKLIPDETVFIDDSPQHINTAEKMGFQAILLQYPETMKLVLEKII